MAASVDPAPVPVADKSTLLIYEDPAFVTSEFPQEANHWSFLQERARPSSPGVIQLSRAAFTRLLANPAGIQDLTELRDLHLADAHFLENLQSWVDFCKAIPPTVWAGVQKLRVDFGGQGVGDLLEQLEDARLLTSIEHLQIFDVKRSEKLFDSIARISKLRTLSLETSYYAPELKKDWQPRTPEFVTPVRLSVSVPYLKRDLMPWLSTFADAPDRHFRSIHLEHVSLLTGPADSAALSSWAHDFPKLWKLVDTAQAFFYTCPTRSQWTNANELGVLPHLFAKTSYLQLTYCQPPNNLYQPDARESWPEEGDFPRAICDLADEAMASGSLAALPTRTLVLEVQLRADTALATLRDLYSWKQLDGQLQTETWSGVRKVVVSLSIWQVPEGESLADWAEKSKTWVRDQMPETLKRGILDILCVVTHSEDEPAVFENFHRERFMEV